MVQMVVVPELVETAARELSAIGSTVDAAHITAAGRTIGMLPAAADEVSSSIAQLFSAEAEEFQKLAGRAAAFHEEFLQRLTASAGAYSSAEAANTSLLEQPVAAPANAIDNLGSAIWTGWFNILEANPALYFALSTVFTVLFFLVAISVIVALIILYPSSPFLEGVAALMSGRG